MPPSLQKHLKAWCCNCCAMHRSSPVGLDHGLDAPVWCSFWASRALPETLGLVPVSCWVHAKRRSWDHGWATPGLYVPPPASFQWFLWEHLCLAHLCLFSSTWHAFCHIRQSIYKVRKLLDRLTPSCATSLGALRCSFPPLFPFYGTERSLTSYEWTLHHTRLTTMICLLLFMARSSMFQSMPCCCYAMKGICGAGLAPKRSSSHVRTARKKPLRPFPMQKPNGTFPACNKSYLLRLMASLANEGDLSSSTLGHTPTESCVSRWAPLPLTLKGRLANR